MAAKAKTIVSFCTID